MHLCENQPGDLVKMQVLGWVFLLTEKVLDGAQQSDHQILQ